ncbi:hypothetical protein [Dickeya oryzae]|uniref:hypothetical protein n=1 Tax=Dickeya oryzae TaxID=1240404 RepID=UPI0012960B55|nr:hypothetical protein [Dickeya oryzae]
MERTDNKDQQRFINGLTEKFSALVSQKGLENTTIGNVIDAAAQYLQNQGIGDRYGVMLSNWSSPIDRVINPAELNDEEKIKKMTSSGHGIASTESEFSIIARQRIETELERYSVNSMFQMSAGLKLMPYPKAAMACKLVALLFKLHLFKDGNTRFCVALLNFILSYKTTFSDRYGGNGHRLIGCLDDPRLAKILVGNEYQEWVTKE